MCYCIFALPDQCGMLWNHIFIFVTTHLRFLAFYVTLILIHIRSEGHQPIFCNYHHNHFFWAITKNPPFNISLRRHHWGKHVDRVFFDIISKEHWHKPRKFTHVLIDVFDLSMLQRRPFTVCYHQAPECSRFELCQYKKLFREPLKDNRYDTFDVKLKSLRYILAKRNQMQILRCIGM